MAIVNTKATAVTNADAATQTANSQKIDGGRLREKVGTVEVANGDSIASTLRFARVRSSDRISRVLLSCDAITSAAGDVGLYDIASVNSGAVVDADFFASAVSLAAALQNSDITHEAGGTGNQFGEIANVEKTIWQSLGLSADPGKLYDVVVTLTAAATAAGTVSLKVQYVDGN